jgi:ribosomal protein S27E
MFERSTGEVQCESCKKRTIAKNIKCRGCKDIIWYPNNELGLKKILRALENKAAEIGWVHENHKCYSYNKGTGSTICIGRSVERGDDYFFVAVVESIE